MARVGLKERRARLGLKQQEIAERLNVSQQTVARWEGGTEIPSKYLKDLAIVLLCRVDQLIGGHDAEDSLAYRRSDPSRADQEVPYGTARLVWLGSDIDPHEESDEWLATQYPISEGEMKRLYSRLHRRDDHASWFIFETLDYRLVMVNRKQLEAFTMVSDAAEAMPPFEHEEVYKAIADHRLRDLLQGIKPMGLVAGDDDLPYSEKLIKRCAELAEEWGGFDQLEDRALAITFETIGGHRESVWAEPRGFEQIAELAFEIDGVDDRDNTPMSEWFIDLFSEGYDRSTLYCLGALRLIEVPLLQYQDADDRLLAGWEE